MSQQTAQATKPIFDKQDQWNRILPFIIDGETLAAVFDLKGGGTGFIGVTDQRIIFLDQAFISKKKAMVSIPYHQIIAVASANEGVVFTSSEITLLTAAGKFEFDFRGGDKAHWCYRYIMGQLLNQANPQLKG